MRTKFLEEVAVPGDIVCEKEGNYLICKKGSHELRRKFMIHGTSFEVSGKNVKMVSEKANKKTISCVKAFSAHLRNMFIGLEKGFVYEMEICNVHFPMTVKVEENKLIVTNFLGEKEKRIAKIVPHVKVEIKGNKLTVSGQDIEAAGQTAANIEKATLISKRDRRVFQDGIFITSKPGREE
jgi:large subunit ribosomal protein L6